VNLSLATLTANKDISGDCGNKTGVCVRDEVAPYFI
jgi:hypothetical protein